MKRQIQLTLFFCFITCFAIYFLIPQAVLFAEETDKPDPSGPEKLALIQALLCEDVVDGIPHTPAIVFPTSTREISCFTFFDPVPGKTFIQHIWYHRDKPSARIRLSLKSPRWATYSTILMRDTDKGPWKVEVTDGNGKILRVLRFSITD